jgi:hypothetical protein
VALVVTVGWTFGVPVVRPLHSVAFAVPLTLGALACRLAAGPSVFALLLFLVLVALFRTGAFGIVKVEHKWVELSFGFFERNLAAARRFAPGPLRARFF